MRLFLSLLLTLSLHGACEAGASRSFDGTDDRVSYSTTFMDATARLSVSLWFNPSNTTQTGRRIAYFYNTGAYGFAIAYRGDAGNTVHFIASDNMGDWGDSPAGTARLKGGTMAANTWFHLCGNVSANDAGGDKTADDAWLDGTAITTTTGGTWASPSDADTLIVGARDSANYFAGNVAWVQVWQGIRLTQGECIESSYHPCSVRVESLKLCLPLLGDAPEIDLMDNTTGTVTGSTESSNGPPVFLSSPLAKIWNRLMKYVLVRGWPRRRNYTRWRG